MSVTNVRYTTIIKMGMNQEGFKVEVVNVWFYVAYNEWSRV